MNVMNTRTVYHWLLILSAFCTVTVGFLLVRSEQHSKALEVALRAEQMKNGQLQAHTPEYFVQKAKAAVIKDNRQFDFRAVDYDVSFGREGCYVKLLKWKGGCSPTALGQVIFVKNGRVITILCRRRQ